MLTRTNRFDPDILDGFVEAVGRDLWQARLAGLGRAGPQSRAGRATLQRHALELMVDRLRRSSRKLPCDAEVRVAALAAEAMTLLGSLPPAGRARLLERLRDGLAGDGTLVPAFHLLRTARLQRERGFAVEHTGLEHGTPYDLLIRRDGMEAELACDVVSAEDGRGVHRGAWCSLADRVDADLQRWLAAHPGRYLLKLTLPHGLKRELDAAGDGKLALLHRRISALLAAQRRADHDEAAVLRLDPLLLAAAQVGRAADEAGLATGLMPRLRREFGPEAHLSVTAAGGGVFVMAARAGAENEVAVAIRRRMTAVAPLRLSGTRPGILAMFVEDVDREEWRLLRDRMDLEGEARQFLTTPDAKRVVAVTCASRLELFGLPDPRRGVEEELRFRNPSHPAAKASALAPAVLSTV